MTQEETDKIFYAITSNGCRDMDEIRFNQAVNEVLELVKNCSIPDVSSSFLTNYSYYAENEGTAKTFKNTVTEKWYYENELCDVIGIKNIEKIKSNCC